ncbi:hypothetical protein [Massilia antarctica]|uniref:hypothetical protein n=1 Tax=Massilia antarctica TaxID=2765360 RepID=UPI00226F796B|nr:hypothetical protein [Massilia sp. H27-R4]MCY0916449.1 hypothetical protein [Massilia sp. H27-R4]
MPVTTLEDVVKPYLHLPTAIQTALMRVETHPTFRRLTKSTLLVLKTLVSRASAQNGLAVIRARLDRMATEANVSYKTVQRAVRIFRDYDWVLPASEGRSEYGVFESRRYVFTHALCALVELPTITKQKPPSTRQQPAPVVRQEPTAAPESHEPAAPPEEPAPVLPQPQPQPEPAVAPEPQLLAAPQEQPAAAASQEKPSPVASQETEMSGGAIYVDLSLKKDLQEISIENRKGNPPTLPPAVAMIPAETGISPTGICKLLGIAKQAGHQLEHVYAIAKPYLAKIGINSARAYRYILAMLHNAKKVDYAAKAAQAQRMSEPDPNAALKAIAMQCRYKRYQHIGKNIAVRFFDGTAEVRIDGHFELYGGAKMVGLYKGVANGNLREVIE